jgi:hypothetical protein
MRIGLALLVLMTGAGAASAQERPLEPELWPIYPPYPYRAGHYPKADWYYKMPPYTAISPSFYRKRFFMMAQERHRYRYMPHIFHGSADAYGDDQPIAEIDMESVAAGVRGTYSE